MDQLNIDYGKCEGCGGCAEAFPQFFEMREEKAWVINADKFVLAENKGVATICPFYAISVDTPKQKRGPGAPW